MMSDDCNNCRYMKLYPENIDGIYTTINRNIIAVTP